MSPQTFVVAAAAAAVCVFFGGEWGGGEVLNVFVSSRNFVSAAPVGSSIRGGYITIYISRYINNELAFVELISSGKDGPAVCPVHKHGGGRSESLQGWKYKGIYPFK